MVKYPEFLGSPTVMNSGWDSEVENFPPQFCHC